MPPVLPLYSLRRSKVLSDNYPERLKRLVLYPFPWWARTIWSMVGVFLDKRTAEKVVLLSGDSRERCPLSVEERTKDHSRISSVRCRNRPLGTLPGHSECEYQCSASSSDAMGDVRFWIVCLICSAIDGAPTCCVYFYASLLL